MDSITQKAELFGTLLARSPLNDDFKEFLLNQVADFTEADLDLLIASLTNEAEMFEKSLTDLEDFTEAKPDREEAYEEILREKLDQVYRQFIKKTDKEIDILALKADLNS